MYTWIDVLSCTEFLGFLCPLLQDLRDGLLGCKIAEDSSHVVDPDKLQKATNDLRYNFDLITAEETEEWLNRQQLSLTDLNRYVLRRILRSEFHERICGSSEEYDLPSETIAAELWPEIVFSDRSYTFTELFLLRLAAYSLTTPEEGPTEAELDSVRHAFCARSNISITTLDSYLVKCTFLNDRFERNLKLEASYQKYCDRIASKDKCSSFLTRSFSDLIKVKYDSLCFTTADAAKEAYLCATEDDDSFPALVARTCGTHHTSSAFLSEVPENIKQLFLSSVPGEFLSSAEHSSEGGYNIYRVLEKIDPTLDDADVYNRLRLLCVKDNLGSYIDDNIEWCDHL